MRIPLILLQIFFTTSLFALESFKSISKLNIEDQNWKIFEQENMIPVIKNHKKCYQLSENKEPNPDILDLYLDFESPIDNLNNYKIIYKNFELNHSINVNGKSSGKFYHSDQYLSLLPYENSLFSPGHNPGSFTIDFSIFFYKGFDNQYILKYRGNNLSDERDKNVYGLSIYIKNRKLVYEFYNFFWSQTGDSYSFTISEDETIQINQWEHHAITFDVMSGKLSTYKNSIEQEVQWITSDRKPNSQILTPSIKEELSTPILIGVNSYYSMDKFKISRDSIQNFYLQKYNNQTAYIKTDVYRFSQNTSEIKKVLLQFTSTQYAHCKLGYRISDHYFLPGDNKIPWVYIQNGIEQFPVDYKRGQYIQFYVITYPYQEMNEPITIRSIQLSYSEDSTPYPPVFLSATPLDSRFSIKWTPSPEDDIAYYEIYYGSRSGEYLDTDLAEGKSPIRYPVKEVGSLAPIEMILSDAQNDKPYFITIRSVDKNGHKSAYSREFYVRPSSIYNENKYSIGR